MNLKFEPESGTAHIECEELAFFARSKSGQSASRYGFRSLSGDAESPTDTDVRYSHIIADDECTYKISGTADAVYLGDDVPTVEFVLNVRRKPDSMNPLSDSAFLAKAMLVAYIAAATDNLNEIGVRLTFAKPSASEQKSYQAQMGIAMLKKMFTVLFERALPFIGIRIARLAEGTVQLQDMSFPYRSLREGQRDFMIEAFRAMRTNRRLIVNAPTGIGKTMSALYPAAKALGEGYTDKIFYLTAKGVTGKAALDAAFELRRKAPLLRAVMISAKDRQCPLATRENPFSNLNCLSGCMMIDEKDGHPYEERRDDALIELLRLNEVYTPEIIAETASKYSLCPYELSLDLSEYCDIVVCDYNYVFDSRIRLKRYFEGKPKEKYTFLIDEAHNLPDRAREMYSASLSDVMFGKLASVLPSVFRGDTLLSESLGETIKMLESLKSLCETESFTDPATGKETVYGTYISSSLPEGISEVLTRFRVACDTRMRQNPILSGEYLEKPRSAVRKMLDSFSLFDSHFNFFLELYGERLTVRSICLDPSSLLDEAMSMASSSVLFSATLSPIDYFSDILGCADDNRVELDSPYDPDNLCLIAYDGISTRLADRADSAFDAAELISTVTEAREGNYIAYFPSYEYMKTVLDEFKQSEPRSRIVHQRPGMSLGERERFLSEFSEASKNSGNTVIGFCVLGGMFSEGIDLRGDRLIGTIIFGTGMPGMSSETNIIRDYFERTRENGKDYAYTYPGFNKVLQAAGRVIRSEDDRGVVILADDRYNERGMQLLFPPHWSNLKYTADTASLSLILGKFWGNAER